MREHSDGWLGLSLWMAGLILAAPSSGCGSDIDAGVALRGALRVEEPNPSCDEDTQICLEHPGSGASLDNTQPIHLVICLGGGSEACDYETEASSSNLPLPLSGYVDFVTQTSDCTEAGAVRDAHIELHPNGGGTPLEGTFVDALTPVEGDVGRFAFSTQLNLGGSESYLDTPLNVAGSVVIRCTDGALAASRQFPRPFTITYTRADLTLEPGTPEEPSPSPSAEPPTPSPTQATPTRVMTHTPTPEPSPTNLVSPTQTASLTPLVSSPSQWAHTQTAEPSPPTPSPSELAPTLTHSSSPTGPQTPEPTASLPPTSSASQPSPTPQTPSSTAASPPPTPTTATEAPDTPLGPSPSAATPAAQSPTDGQDMEESGGCACTSAPPPAEGSLTWLAALGGWVIRRRRRGPRR